jgi:serine/threonine-protein kinase
VVDFGLARAIGAAEYRRLTETGIVVGTIHYMSPEQLRDEKHLDQRADIYGLGCVVYEVLSGGPPFVGRSLTDLVAKILRAPVPPLRRINPAVPVAVEQAIGRALAKSSAERFATMDEFATALGAAAGRG